MSLPEPQDPGFAARVIERFAAQAFMATLGARLGVVEAGCVEILLPIGRHLGQQEGFVHAGALWSIADSASGFAAQSLMPAHAEVLTVELKINLIRPARGRLLRATGNVRRAGRTLSVCETSVTAHDTEEGSDAGREVALTLGTFMCMTREVR
ncbi:MAG: PaaI family thioesterase [Pseudomonadota bacterium]